MKDLLILLAFIVGGTFAMSTNVIKKPYDYRAALQEDKAKAESLVNAFEKVLAHNKL